MGRAMSLGVSVAVATLIEQRLEDVVVGPIDDRDVGVRHP
jgi:hypothetical protein